MAANFENIITIIDKIKKHNNEKRNEVEARIDKELPWGKRGVSLEDRAKLRDDLKNGDTELKALFDQLIAAITQNPQGGIFPEINEVGFTDQQLAFIFQILSENPQWKLQVLNLTGSGERFVSSHLGQKSKVALIALLEKSPWIEVIDLAAGKFSLDEAMGLFYALAKNTNNGVTHFHGMGINFESDNSSYDVFNNAYLAFIRSGKKLKDLEILELYRLTDKQQARLLETIQSPYNAIQTIRIDTNAFKGESLKAFGSLLRKTRSLRKVDFGQSHLALTDEQQAELINEIAKNPNKTIQEIRFATDKECVFRAKSLEAFTNLLKTNTSLKRVHLTGLGLTDEQQAQLVRALTQNPNEGVEILALDEKALGPSTQAAYLSFLKTSHAIKRLNAGLTSSDSELASLFAAISSNPHSPLEDLSRLYFSPGKESVDAFENLLTKSPNLKYVSLPFHSFGTDKALARILTLIADTPYTQLEMVSTWPLFKSEAPQESFQAYLHILERHPIRFASFETIVSTDDQQAQLLKALVKKPKVWVLPLASTDKLYQNIPEDGVIYPWEGDLAFYAGVVKFLKFLKPEARALLKPETCMDFFKNLTRPDLAKWLTHSEAGEDLMAYFDHERKQRDWDKGSPQEKTSAQISVEKLTVQTLQEIIRQQNWDNIVIVNLKADLVKERTLEILQNQIPGLQHQSKPIVKSFEARVKEQLAKSRVALKPEESNVLRDMVQTFEKTHTIASLHEKEVSWKENLAPYLGRINANLHVTEIITAISAVDKEEEESHHKKPGAKPSKG